MHKIEPEITVTTNVNPVKVAILASIDCNTANKNRVVKTQKTTLTVFSHISSSPLNFLVSPEGNWTPNLSYVVANERSSQCKLSGRFSLCVTDFFIGP